MTKIRKEEIEQIKAKADIVQVVGHYIPLQQNGSKYVGLCPFHEDHNPSFQVNPANQFCWCFVCHKGGDVFSFVQQYEQVSFPEAVEKVADLVGFTLSERPEREQRQIDPHKERLLGAMSETIRYTESCLSAPQGRQAARYLAKRGIDAETMKRFEIGWDPGMDSLYQELKKKGIQEQDMLDVNVVRSGSYGFYDVFGSRITFPIHSFRGEPIGFTARSMDPNARGKYINTAETELYKKGSVVFNAHRARASARKTGRVYVCEGVMDVIAFDQAGMPNAVCTLGTACTPEQIRILQRLAPMIVFCYDGDEAGQNATWRAVQMVREAGGQPAVVENKTGLDPDEILRQGGAGALKDLAAKTISWMEFYLQYLQKRMNLNSFLEKKEFAEKAAAQIASLPDPSDRRYFTEKVIEITGLPLDSYETGQPERSSRFVPADSRTVMPDGVADAEKEILGIMMKEPKYVPLYEEQLGYLRNDVSDRLADLIVSAYHADGRTSPQILMDETEDEEVRRLITEISMGDLYNTEFTGDMMKGAMRRVKITYLQNVKRDLQSRLNTEVNEIKRQELSQQFREILNELRRLHDEQSK